jgi:hypothetical protein
VKTRFQSLLFQILNLCRYTAERCVKEAKNKIKSIIEEVVAKQALPGGFGSSVGKYKV